MARRHPLPAELSTLVERSPGSVLFSCAQETLPGAASGVGAGSHREAGVTRLFTAPRRTLRVDRLDELPALFGEIECAAAAGLYAAGYFGYECGAFFEATSGADGARRGSAGGRAAPLAWFGIYNQPALFDHRSGELLHGGAISLEHCPAPDAGADILPACELGLDEAVYSARVESILDKIRAGDVYQLNFTLPVRVRAQGSTAGLYLRLRERQPGPYSAFLHAEPGKRILSFSPEMFFHLESVGGTRRIVMRPMKGTAPRGRTAMEDRAAAHALCTDAKNRAENIMIVDLVRSDLGRICNYGTIEARDLFAVERYPTLWQMTSTVTGELRPDANFQQIFRALFPSGSVTGAPKVRAMQLISEFEAAPRGIYTGAIGFFSRQESTFNVAIRTLALDGESGSAGVGSGIVIDSRSEMEWKECALKTEFLFASSLRRPSNFSLVETLLWDGGYPLIELHLGRLAGSADYFGFPCERWEVRGALLAEAAAFADCRRRKVRLLLAEDGSLRIESQPLAEKPAGERPLRVALSARRVDPQDPMLFHKTTHRPLHAQALASAVANGCDEILFFNDRGEVTEASNHNVFIERAGRLITPPVECGLIPGVHRQLILETHPAVSERRLALEDLRNADAIFLSNAVRGLIPAEVILDVTVS